MWGFDAIILRVRWGLRPPNLTQSLVASCREMQLGGLAEDEPSPPLGTISTLVPRKLSHNTPLSTAKLLRTDQNLEFFCQREGLQ